MLKRLATWLVAGLTVLAAPVWAETAYVIDRIVINMRWSPAADAPVVKSLTTGARVEVLERSGNQTRVRDADGSEGWVNAEALTGEAPARHQLDRLKSQLSSAQRALEQETAKTKDLAQKLAELAAKQNVAAEDKAAAAPSPPPVAAAPPAAPQPLSSGTAVPFFSLPWLGISFAMLIVGFIAGVLWVREVNRRKLGGMHLRI